MRTLLSLWNDEAGFIVSAELVLLGTLLVVGLLAGMTCMQEAVIGEYQDVAGAISSLDQSLLLQRHARLLSAGMLWLRVVDGGIGVSGVECCGPGHLRLHLAAGAGLSSWWSPSCHPCS